MAIKPVEIVIKADDKATPEIKNVAKSMEAIAPAAQRAGASSDASLDGMHKRGVKAADGIRSISEQLALVQKAFVLFQGGGALTGLIKDTAATADEYANLSARIKLATGEGQAFENAMAAVTEISLRTNSSLQATGNLFARLTEAGKSAGLGAQAAQTQALALTESINQAVAVSGSSAQASDAALTQLIQGLQSGVLRGEEFNSVMEQSPRLARALADGLGVTTGELRKMANEGRLTTEVVIGALKSQADTLKSEFETLPLTVGRAVQNLSTAWTVYVGETDKATGASRTAAQAIGALAENLDTIAGYLLDAGQAAAAFAALRLAQTFTGIGVAAAASATAVASSTAAMTAAGAAGTAAALGVGRFAAILSTLKTFTLLGIVTNFQDIGTWIGEGIAKLQGYKDKTDELAQAERSRMAVAEEQRKIIEAQAAANRAAAEAQFELSRAAQSSLAVFEDLVAKGKTAGEAVAEIGKDFDLASQPGIANAAAVLDKLAADGKISAEQFRQAWADALKGEDLQAFETRARAALAGAAREGDRLAAIMDGTLREAIRRSGGDFDVLAGGMSKASRSAINDTDTIINGLERLKAQGVDVGQALEMSLNKAIKTADSQAAIDALRSRVEQLRKQLGDQVANGLLKQIEDQAAKATGALNGLDSALKKLGITSDTELKKAANETRGLFEAVVKAGGSAREQAAAFEKMAAAAVASGDAGALAFTRSQAAARGFEVTTDAAGKTTVRSMNEAAEATRGAGAAADGAAGSYRNMGQSAEQAAASAAKLAEINARYAGPLGPDKFSAPKRGSVTGNSREERLAGQNAVDNSLQFNLRDKLQAGELTQDDLASLKNVVAALRQREQIDRDVDRMNPAGFSSEGLQDRREWEQVRLRFEEAISRLGGGDGNRVGRTVQVNINTGQGRETVNTDDAGAAALVRSLQSASLSAGR
jgi:tape measure domain-containing protein